MMPPTDSSDERLQRIFLTGYMGAGKSTIGQLLAKSLKRRFYDTDRLAVKGFGHKHIAQIFAEHGEAAFRQAELAIIQELCKRRNFVASTGGGTLIRPETLAPAKRNGIVIYLQAPVDVLYERVVFSQRLSSKDRPLLSQENPETLFKTLFYQRESFYLQSDIIVSTNGQERKAVVERIIDELKAYQDNLIFIIE